MWVTTEDEMVIVTRRCGGGAKAVRGYDPAEPWSRRERALRTNTLVGRLMCDMKQHGDSGKSLKKKIVLS